MLLQLLFLFSFLSGDLSLDYNDEYLDIYANEKFQLKEAVVWLKSATVSRGYLRPDSECCLGSDGSCGTSCQLQIIIKCDNFQTDATITDVIYGFSSDINKVIRLNNSECLAGNAQMIVLDGSKELLFSTIISTDHRAQVIQKPKAVNSNKGLYVDYVFTYNCDVEYGEYCKKKCIPTNSRERCDPFTGEVLCRQGFYGKNCSETTDLCLKEVCLNGGKCTTLPSGYECACLAGYSGKNCEKETCEIFRCQNNGECKDYGDGAFCMCNDNTAGRHCEITCSPTCQQGKCVLKNGEPKCECKYGYTGKACSEALLGISCNRDIICGFSGVCVNIPGGHVCVCPKGWEGLHCRDPICHPNNCIHGMCINGAPCQCYSSYFGETCNLLTCQVIHSCNNRGTCVSSSRDTVRCLCRRSFAGLNCEHECKPGCGIFGRCVLTRLGPLCECDDNHKGPQCTEEIPSIPCPGLECKNGGICVQRNFEFLCQCPPYWVGENCERATCNRGNCNHGACLKDKGCICVEGFTDPTCTFKACQPGFCKNDGVCVSNGVSQKCVCNPARSTGERCEIACAPACVNGFCHYDSNFTAKCSCPPGFIGESCDVFVTIGEYYKVLNTSLAVATAIMAIILVSTVSIYIASQTCFKRSMFKKRVEIDITAKPSDKLDSTWNDLSVY